MQNKLVIDAIDRFTAEKIGNASYLFCYLSAAYRYGALFVQITKEGLTPHPKVLFRLSDETVPVSEEEWQGFQRDIVQEFTTLAEGESQFVVKVGSKLYLKKAYEIEQVVATHFARLQSAAIDTPYDDSQFRLLVVEALSNQKLLPEQATAILQAIEQPITFIFGGPGTGKTYTAGLFVKFFIKSLPKELSSHLRIALVGPTGKAASNLLNSIQRALGDTLNMDYIEAKTLHALLGIKRSLDEERNQKVLSYQLIIVDETSMMDAQLMAEFLSRIQSGTKVLFLGDPDQLPPIEPGDLFFEFIAKERAYFTPNRAPGELQTCVRTELAEILELARLVKDEKKDGASVLEFLLERQREDGAVVFRHVEHSSMEEVLQQEAGQLFAEFSKMFAGKDAGQAIESQQQFRILTPRKEGSWGVVRLNQLFQEMGKSQSDHAVPILISRNDYILDVMNGEMGVMIGKKKAYFAAKHKHQDKVEEGKRKKVREVPVVLLSQYELGYALSVHKSQGSEFDKVLLLLPPGSELFGRRMLYTAITRVTRRCEGVSHKQLQISVLSPKG